MSLILAEQQSCFHEELVDNGKNVQIHYVVKKTPFLVRLQVSKDSAIDFKNGKLECVLRYEDNDNTVIVPDGGQPLEFVAHTSPDGKECKLELRVYMLTTQANGIRFVAHFKLSKTGVASYVLESHPMVVVSKQQQIRNKVAEAARQQDPNARAKKRVRQDDLFEMLDMIRETQLEQAQQLSRLVPGYTPALATQVKSEQSAPLSVQEALSALVAAYRREFEDTHRADNLHRLVAAADEQTQKDLREIGSSFIPHFEGCGALS